ncbi:radical SAM/SPASM domain-containing protein [Tepidibacter thalassicus]|nr:radical SAM protein [Tepidibacter thalassicus]
MLDIKTYKSPFCVVWEITDSCNLKCSHCRTSAVDPNSHIGNPENEDKIIDILIKNDILVVNISGGEPLLNPRCTEIVKKLTQKGIYVGLSTNGILFPKYAQQLKDANLGYVQISLDGPEEVHNKFRNSTNAYQKAIDALKIAKKMGFRVQLNCVANVYNIDYLQHVYDFANTEDIEMHVRRFVPSGYGKDNIDLIPDYNDHFRMLKVLNNMQKDSKVRVSIEAPLIHFLEDSNVSNLIGCGAGITQLGIDKDGNAYPCIFFRKNLGNILESGFEDIWFNSNVLKKMRNRDFEKCKDCHAKVTCGGCQACSEYPFGEDPLCPLEVGKVSEQDIEKMKVCICESKESDLS